MTELVERCLTRIGGGRGGHYILAWLMEVDPSSISRWLDGSRTITDKNRQRLEYIAAADTIKINLKPLTRLVMPEESDVPPQKASDAKIKKGSPVR